LERIQSELEKYKTENEAEDSESQKADDGN
jgi:hypothetical protein